MIHHRLAIPSLSSALAVLALVASQASAQGTINLQNSGTLNTGNIPGRSARADLDGDGDLDLVVLNVGDNTATVWRHDTNLSFTPIQTLNTQNNPSDVDLVDMNGDSLIDVLVTTRSGFNQVYLNSGTGSFAAPLNSSAGFDSYSSLPIELTGDSIPELLICNYTSNRISLAVNDGLGNLTLVGSNFAGGGGPTEILTADLDADSDADLVVCLAGSNAVLIIENNGGVFTPSSFQATGTFPLDMIVGDFNYDGLPDIVTCNVFSNDVTFIRNTGNLTFAAGQSFAVGDRPTSIATANIDNGLGFDLVVATFNGGALSVLPNNGLSNFGTNIVRPTGANPYEVIVGDFDADFDEDLLSINLGSNTITVIENTTPLRRYPGSDEDLNLVSMIDGVTNPSNQGVTVGFEGSLVVNTLISFTGTFDNEIGIIAIQQYNPGFPPFTMTPGLYLNNFGYPTQVLIQQILVPGGITVQLNVPVGIAGAEFMVQGFAVTPIANNGMSAFTDALEFRVLP